MSNQLPALSLLETRVIGVLFEKQHTVPDTYPLTLNALVSGCNQKTSRDPVMAATESEVQTAIDGLKGYSLVMETSGGRVARYAHNLERVLQLPQASAALVTALMLRGPQTAGELRIGCERTYKFSDISSVQGFLEQLAARPAGALAIELPRLSGSRENRWAHLLSGVPEIAQASEGARPAGPSGDVAVGEVAALKANVARLESEIGDLRETVRRICAELGIDAGDSK